MDKEKLKIQLIEDEGLRLYPYKDTVGKFTVGCGRNLDDKGLSKDELFFLGIRAKTKEEVISYLMEHPLTKEDCMYLLDNDIDEVYEQLKKQFSWFEFKPDIVQRVMANMVFNLGLPRFLEFTKTINAIKYDRWETAAREMLNSRWANQVPNRARRLSNSLMILTD